MERVKATARRPRKPEARVKLMLDSGAFSAWNQGGVIELQEYMEYIQEFESRLFSYAVLDVLPFGLEARRSVEAIEHCAAASYKNLKTMQREGLQPLPIFHQGERFYWLEKMVGEGEPYIGLSTRKDLWTSAQRGWLDRCFNFLTDARGAPLIKTHGFGITKFELMQRYPWFTVDSTTWLLSSGYGKVLVPPRGLDGKPDYSRPPVLVITSGDVQGSKSATKKKHDQWAIYSKSLSLDWIIEYLWDYAGVTIAEARHTPAGRRRAILSYYEGLCRARKCSRFLARSAQNMMVSSAAAGLKPKKNLPFHLMYATSLNHQFSINLTDAGVWTRLLSYYEMREKPLEIMDEYLTTGILSGYVPRTKYLNWNTEAYKNYRAMSLIKRLKEQGVING